MSFSTIPTAPAIYVRWSTDEQGSGTTLEEQKQTCLTFMADRGWQVSEDLLFVDDGYSAGSLERPAMKKLRALVGAGAVDAVVVYKLDRLTRNIVDAVDLVLREWEGRCALVSVTQSAIDTTNALGRQFFTLMASFAEFEREMIRDRTLSGKKRRAMQGRNPGIKPPYGYKLGAAPGEVLVDGTQAPVIERIFSDFCAGRSLLEIARQLNHEAVPGPGKSGGWSDRTIRYMLQNPFYIGRLEYGCTTVNSPRQKQLLGRHKTKHKAPRWAVVPGAFPALIAQETWETVQALLRQRRRGTGFKCRAASSSYLLTGLLKCRCGYAYAGVTARGVDYYRCRNTAPGVCRAGYVRADIADEAVLEAIREQMGSQVGQSVLAVAEARAEAARAAAEAARINLNAALATVTRQREKVRRDYIEGELAGRLFSDLMSEIDRKESELRAGLRDAEATLANPRAAEVDAAWLLGHIDQVMSDSWHALAQTQKKSSLRALVASILAYREGKEPRVEVEITLNSLDRQLSTPVAYEKQIVQRRLAVS